MVYNKICKKCGRAFCGKSPKASICDDCKDVTGQKIGMWQVIQKAPQRGRHDYYLCKCDCGTVREVSGDSLRAGTSTSCGCVSKNKLIARHREQDDDLTGQKCGEITVIRYNGVSEGGRRLWLCQCSCGNTINLTTTQIKSGKIKSCGHLYKTEVAKIADCGTNPASIASQKMSKRNTSGIKGVWYDQRRGKWTADIMFRRKKYRLGRYKKKEDAAAARKEAEERLHGGFLEWYKEAYPDKWGKISRNSEDI